MKRLHVTWRYLIQVMAAVTLCACGGGGGGSSAPAPAAGGTTLQTEVAQAKSMFAVLRQLVHVFTDNNNSFLNTLAVRAGNDLQNYVAPELQNLAQRVDTLGWDISSFESAQAYTPSTAGGFVAGTHPLTGLPALVRSVGDLKWVWSGYGSYDACWTDAAGSLSSVLTCEHADANAADTANLRIKLVIYQIQTGSGANAFQYSATRYDQAIVSALNPVPNGAPTVSTDYPTPQSGVLTLTTGDIQTVPTTMTINGSFPPVVNQPVPTPVSGASAPGVGTVKVTALRTPTVCSSNSANTACYHVVVTASGASPGVQVAPATGTGVVTQLALATSGSYDWFAQTVAPFGSGLSAATLAGLNASPTIQFFGTLNLSGYNTNTDGVNYVPTTMALSTGGTITDTSANGAQAVMRGGFNYSISNYNSPYQSPTGPLYASFHSSLALSDSNFLQTNSSFSGTASWNGGPNPAASLSLSGSMTGVDLGSYALNYTTGVSGQTGYINISSHGTVSTGNTSANSGQNLVLTNQDNITVLPFANGSGNLSVTDGNDNNNLATVQNGMVNYVDGSSESLY